MLWWKRNVNYSASSALELFTRSVYEGRFIMRKTMKKAITAGVLSMAMIMSMAGCGSSGGNEVDTTRNVSEIQYTVGISQFAEHGSLDNCREGFLEGLKEEGIVEGENLTVEEGNANADMVIENLKMDLEYE